jgi:hypothetical protein
MRAADRRQVVSLAVVLAAIMAIGGCSAASSTPGVASCFVNRAAAGTASGGQGWALPGGDLANTRDVAS